MTLDGKILRGIFEHERLKPAVIRTNQGNVQNLADLKTGYEHRLKIQPIFLTSYKISLNFSEIL